MNSPLSPPDLSGPAWPAPFCPASPWRRNTSYKRMTCAAHVTCTQPVNWATAAGTRDHESVHVWAVRELVQLAALLLVSWFEFLMLHSESLLLQHDLLIQTEGNEMIPWINYLREKMLKCCMNFHSEKVPKHAGPRELSSKMASLWFPRTIVFNSCCYRFHFVERKAPATERLWTLTLAALWWASPCCPAHLSGCWSVSGELHDESGSASPPLPEHRRYQICTLLLVVNNYFQTIRKKIK